MKETQSAGGLLTLKSVWSWANCIIFTGWSFLICELGSSWTNYLLGGQIVSCISQAPEHQVNLSGLQCSSIHHEKDVEREERTSGLHLDEEGKRMSQGKSLNEHFQDDSYSTVHPKKTLHSRVFMMRMTVYCISTKVWKLIFQKCPSNSSFHERNNTQIHLLTLLMFQVPYIFMHLILITTRQHIIGFCLQLGLQFKRKFSHTCKQGK